MTRRLIIQKARRHPPNGTPTACRRTVSGSLSPPCPGCFSPFLHSTGPLSVFCVYLALRDGPRCFSQDSSCPGLLRIAPPPLRLPVRDCHPLRPTFPDRSGSLRSRLFVLLLPRRRLHGPGLGSLRFARRYSGDRCFFLLLQVLRCFSSLRNAHGLRHVSDLQPDGFPHSDTCGSFPVCGSPQIFAACRVLLRPQKPRHPPFALRNFFSRNCSP